MLKILLSSVLLVICFTTVIGQNVFSPKELKQLEKMDIKAAIYEQEVNEPTISKILLLERSHLKTLIPAIALNSFSATVCLLAFSTDHGFNMLFPFAIVVGTLGGSIPLHIITLTKRIKRNRLINQL